MGTTQLSRMIRVRNEISEQVQQLNELCRTGSVPLVVKEMDALIEFLKRGETFSDRHTQDRLNQLETLVTLLGNGTPIAPAAAVEELTMQQLCQRFNIGNASYQADWNHKTVEKWLEEKTGWRYMGGDRFSSPA